MTLFITAATLDVGVNVADTRLTYPDRSLADDSVPKTVVVHCINSEASVSYTGLAEIQGGHTGTWLVQQLQQSPQAEMTLDDLAYFLRDELTKASKHDSNLGKIGLTLEVVGLGTTTGGERSWAIATVTNSGEPEPRRGFKLVNPQGRDFVRYLMYDTKGHYLGMSGSVDETRALASFRKKNCQKIKISEEYPRKKTHFRSGSCDDTADEETAGLPRSDWRAMYLSGHCRRL